MKLDKPQAIERRNQQLGRAVLTSGNSLFAELDPRRNIWWFDLQISLLKEHEWLNLLLSTPAAGEQAGQLLHLKVPTSFLRQRLTEVEVRNAGKRKSSISLELSADRDSYLKDQRPKGSQLGFEKFVQV